MIPPFLPQTLPGLTGQGRGTNAPGQEATPDFANWLQQHPAQSQPEPQPPAAGAEEPSTPRVRQSNGHNLLEQLQTVEAPHLPTLEEMLQQASEAWDRPIPAHEGAHPRDLPPVRPLSQLHDFLHAQDLPHSYDLPHLHDLPHPHDLPRPLDTPHPHELPHTLDLPHLRDLPRAHAHAPPHLHAVPHPHAQAPELPPSALGEAQPPVRPDPRIGALGERLDQVEIPWRLQANAGLSYIGSGRLMQALAARTAQLSGSPVVPGTGTRPNVASPEMARFAVFERDAHAVRNPGEVAATASEVEAGAAASAPERLQARLAPLLSWPHRMLRWLEDREGATAWVRDYRADATSMAALVDSLRCTAAEQGLPLRRIMLNGRELWRAANPST